ncbi:MAG TPA: hypothetical protein VM840_13045 [Actinomycetota bacterium]|nr:hypothetical protein [Actinomycetota bacterium]
MGTRTSEVLKEIEQIRDRLDANLVELETRMPPIARLGRKAIGIAVGGGAGSAALLIAVKKIRGGKDERKAKGREDERVIVQPAPVVVKLLPAGAVPVAVLAVATWAGVRVTEAWLSRMGGRSGSRDAVVRPLPARSTG